ncbi:brachyurin-like [Uranotaenia lowii]|uniref:brachyurin-like n=1 Tax=Uranotaenia lowii TaxID=190385 RepID=UPI0024798745|nr:brachyurin-like [Uranotaenia lowii]
MNAVWINLFVLALSGLAQAGYETPTYVTNSVIPGGKTSRIVNGKLAQLGQFPYQVYMILSDPNGYSVVGGGSIISDEWILTAAHCIHGVTKADVYMGAVYWYSADRVMIPARSFIQHPSYVPTAFTHDIGLIRLSAKITFNTVIKPISLASAEDGPYEYLDDAQVSGFGKTSDLATYASSYLYYTDVMTISNDECKQTFAHHIIDSTICSRSLTANPVSHSCSGDSGGPLVYRGVQIGVVSFGASGGCEKNYPKAYARVSAFRNWIRCVTGV